MNYTMEISENRKYIRTVVTGKITREFAGRYSVAASEFGKANGIDRFLFDVRDARNVESTMQNYQYAYTDLPRLELERKVRVAIFRDPEDHSHDFIELVAANAGYNVRFFDDEESALAWLDV